LHIPYIFVYSLTKIIIDFLNTSRNGCLISQKCRL